MKNQIDLNTIKKCSSCDLKKKIKNKNVCAKCDFKFGRDGAYHTKNNISKSHLFYFLYHPELNFKFPELPEKDFLGTEKRKPNHKEKLIVMYCLSTHC